MSSSLTVRPARVEDVAQMARVNVRSQQETYRGLMADAVLDDPGSHRALLGEFDKAAKQVYRLLGLGSPQQRVLTYLRSRVDEKVSKEELRGSHLRMGSSSPGTEGGAWVAHLDPYPTAGSTRQWVCPRGDGP